MLGQPGGDNGRGCRSAANADRPVRSAQTLGIELTDHPHDTMSKEPPVASSNGLLGGSEDFRETAERRSWINVESLDDSSVYLINYERSHAIQSSR